MCYIRVKEARTQTQSFLNEGLHEVVTKNSKKVATEKQTKNHQEMGEKNQEKVQLKTVIRLTNSQNLQL